jgi:hypothetical protein
VSGSVIDVDLVPQRVGFWTENPDKENKGLRILKVNLFRLRYSGAVNLRDE